MMPENYQDICAQLENGPARVKGLHVLGGASYGDIYSFIDPGGERFALKRFRDGKHCSAPELAMHACQVHRKFKDLGLTVHDHYDHVYPGWVKMPAFSPQKRQ